MATDWRQRRRGRLSSPDQRELPLDPPPRRLFSCSPSKLMTWVDCPRRFRFTYLDRPTPIKGPPWGHLSYGTSVHNALRAWWDLPLNRRTPESAGDLVRTGWLVDGFRDDAQSEQWKHRAATQVSDYVTSIDPEQDPVGVERTVALRTDKLAFSGRVDRIDERGGNAVVVDYKTGRSVPRDTDVRASMALALYAEATSRTLRKPSRRVELHHLPTGTVAVWDHSDESVARHVQRADSIGAEALQTIQRAKPDDDADAAFPAKPGSLCAWCDFRSHCPEGQKAGPAHKPWDGLQS